MEQLSREIQLFLFCIVINKSLNILKNTLLFNYIKYKINQIKIMEQKKNNNLIRVTIGDEVFYYTSYNRAGVKLGLKAIQIQNRCFTGKPVLYNSVLAYIDVVDGSNITYDKINN